MAAVGRVFTTAQIATINANIAAGIRSHGPFSELWNSDTGQQYFQSGVGTAAQFLPVGSTSAPASASFYYKGGLLKFNAAKLRVNAPPRIVAVGDSNLAGNSAGTGGLGAIGARELGWPILMARTFGWQTGSFFGDQVNGDVGITLYDPRIVLGTNWNVNAATGTIFGARLLQNGTTTGRLAFTPEQIFDRLVIHFPILTAGTQNSVNVYVDGALVGSYSCLGGAVGAGTLPISVALGSHLVEVQGNSTGTCYVSGIETFNSTSKSPVLLLGGWDAGKWGDIADTSQAYSSGSKAISLQPDLLITHCTINDLTPTPTAVATVAGSIASLTNAANVAGADIYHTVSWPFNADPALNGPLDAIAKQLYSHSVAFNGAFADARAAIGGSWALANARNLAFNALHPNAAGHVLEAAFFGNVFR